MIFFLEIKNQKLEPKSIVARTTLNRQSSKVAPFEGGIGRKKKKKFHRIRVKQETGLEDLTTTRVQKDKKEKKKRNFRGAERGHWHFVTGQVEQPG